MLVPAACRYRSERFAALFPTGAEALAIQAIALLEKAICEHVLAWA
jgi:hypothetical protein